MSLHSEGCNLKLHTWVCGVGAFRPQWAWPALRVVRFQINSCNQPNSYLDSCILMIELHTMRYLYLGNSIFAMDDAASSGKEIPSNMVIWHLEVGIGGEVHIHRRLEELEEPRFVHGPDLFLALCREHVPCWLEGPRLYNFHPNILRQNGFQISNWG